MRSVLFRHPSSLEHDTGPHPERAARIVAIERELERREWLGFEPRLSPPVARPTLEAVHTARHVERIEALCAAGGGMIDLDTVCSPGSFAAAAHAAGGAVAMVDELLGGAARAGASVHRPPGHHAEAGRAMGFCLFNSVAVAARHALDAHDAGRVAVIDWDVHHGNGTNDIFHDDPSVLYVSVHESPLYPGTGPASDVGSGPGAGFTVNLPVPGGSGDETWCSLLEHVAVPVVRDFDPALVLVSAGFDAHLDDPLAGCRVTDAGFATMAGSVRRLFEELDVPVGLVLEGGYEVAALARSLAATLAVLGASSPPQPDPALAVHPLAARARARLAARWPTLA
ncbi:MAG TPA: histone deacetylase [Solirubrobacteraceae bacterium]|nr:histone deacetylase [Solirubrobacteraceae bacterium]